MADTNKIRIYVSPIFANFVALKKYSDRILWGVKTAEILQTRQSYVQVFHISTNHFCLLYCKYINTVLIDIHLLYFNETIWCRQQCVFSAR